MTKKFIKILAEKSFVRKELDFKKVKLFASKMKRKDLREYIGKLKAINSQNRVRVVVPDLESFSKKDISPILKYYRGKKIAYEEDPSLLVGVKLIDNDLIYDFNLKNSFENLIEEYDN